MSAEIDLDAHPETQLNKKKKKRKILSHVTIHNCEYISSAFLPPTAKKIHIFLFD